MTAEQSALPWDDLPPRTDRVIYQDAQYRVRVSQIGSATIHLLEAYVGDDVWVMRFGGEDWAHVVARQAGRVTGLEARVAELEARVAELEAQA